MDVDQSFSEQTLLGDVSDQMEQLLIRPNITYDGKGILIFEPYSESRGREAEGGCINGMLQYLSIKYNITSVINNDTGVQ